MPSALVIGGGPAGCVAAIALARQGWRVTLAEQKRFPRDKVCGECLSATGIAVLDRLGLHELFADSARQFTATHLHPRRGRSLQLPLPQPMWGISRRLMDATLLEAARRERVTVHQPARCLGITPAPAPGLPAEAVLRDLAGTANIAIEADAIIPADGSGALCDTAGPATEDFGLKAHFTGVRLEPTAIHLFGVDGSYGGIAAVEQGRFNFAFSVPAARLKQYRGDLDALFEQLRSENNHLADALAEATRVTSWNVCPLPRFAARRNWPAGVWPVGNAAAAIEPIAGEGMGLAMRSAELAAEHIANGRSQHALHRRYARLWRRKRLLTRAAAVLMSQASVAQLSLTALRLPGTGTAALRMVGK